MPVDYGFKKGVDFPIWQWLAQCPVVSQPGASNCYDGVRYIYWTIQSGSSATAASTTQLWRYDTWSDGWQFLANLISGNQGLDMEFDNIRNVIYIINGAALTSWQVFNLNTTAVTICGVSCAAWAATTMTPILPAAAGVSASITMPDDASVLAPIDTLAVATGSTATSIISSTGRIGPGVVGLQVRFTSGTLAGQRRAITAATGPSTMTVNAFGSAPAAGDAFVIELPEGTAIAGSTTTSLAIPSDYNQTANFYRESDVIITGGTGVGQRRRISASANGSLTIAGAVTGNPRTGPFTTTPDATSTFRIVPSSDFLYYQPGSTSAALYKIDLVANPAATWVTKTSAPAIPAGGANSWFAQSYSPFSLLQFRGSGTATYYHYWVGLDSWTTPTIFVGGETFNTGASVAALHGDRKLYVSKESTQRAYILDLTTGIYEPAPLEPYAAPGALDGHRSRGVKTVDGFKWLYHLRAGGQELWRIPLEWY